MPNDPTTVGPNPQQPVPNVPEVDPSTGAPAPFAYVTPAACVQNLLERWNLEPPYVVTEGHVLVASQHCDQEGPWQGTKVQATQERSWPRTFRYGWPNIIAAPSPVMVAIQNPGAWPLNYEGVVPQQIIDWTCLEVYRLLSLPLLRLPAKESVTGASITYAPPLSAKDGWETPMDEIMTALIAPFQMRAGRTSAFTHLQGFGGNG